MSSTLHRTIRITTTAVLGALCLAAALGDAAMAQNRGNASRSPGIYTPAAPAGRTGAQAIRSQDIGGPNVYSNGYTQARPGSYAARPQQQPLVNGSDTAVDPNWRLRQQQQSLQRRQAARAVVAQPYHGNPNIQPPPESARNGARPHTAYDDARTAYEDMTMGTMGQRVRRYYQNMPIHNTWAWMRPSWQR